MFLKLKAKSGHPQQTFLSSKLNSVECSPLPQLQQLRQMSRNFFLFWFENHNFYSWHVELFKFENEKKTSSTRSGFLKAARCRFEVLESGESLNKRVWLAVCWSMFCYYLLVYSQPVSIDTIGKDCNSANQCHQRHLSIGWSPSLWLTREVHTYWYTP